MDSQQTASTRPITQAAGEIRYVDKARLYHSHGQIRLDDALLSQPGPSFHAARVTTTLRSFALHDITLDGDTGFVFQDQCLIPETIYVAPHQADRDRAGARNGVIQLDDAYDHIIAYNPAHGFYQHWLTQCLPAIDWAVRQPRKRLLRLVLPPLAEWQENFLDFLGHSQLPRLTIKPGLLYLIPHAEYSEFLNGTASFGVCLSVHETARRILDRLPPTPSPHRILAVPCSNPYYGTIRNEQEAFDLLRRRGAYIVPEHLTPAERINLFRHADVVVGPFGQGLTDVLFCQPGTLLWEWVPRHHQNFSINRLAQAAGLDYWGDLFAGDPAADAAPAQWVVDPATVTRRISEISERLASPTTRTKAAPPLSAHPLADKPLDELMLAFESLGDNCEFGLLQRHAGVDPLGLLRFAGTPLTKLVAALETKFERVGSIDTTIVYPFGQPGRRELMVHQTSIDTRYHTFIFEGEVDLEDFRQREAKRLGFLRRKLLEDLAVGEKIWVYREPGLTDPALVQPLVGVLRRLGPNTLLWVVEADADHPPGTVEPLGPDIIKGYVTRLAPYEAAGDFEPFSWFEVCARTFALLNPAEAPPQPAQSVATQVDTLPAIQLAEPDPSPAIQPATTNPLPAIQPAATDRPATQPEPPPTPRTGWFSWLRHLLGI